MYTQSPVQCISKAFYSTVKRLEHEADDQSKCSAKIEWRAVSPVRSCTGVSQAFEDVVSGLLYRGAV